MVVKLLVGIKTSNGEWDGSGRSRDRPGDTFIRMHYSMFSRAGEPNAMCGLLTVLYLCTMFFCFNCVLLCSSFLFPQGSRLTGQEFIMLFQTIVASTYLITPSYILWVNCLN